uniref:Uncharacterized protein n=1 Tax=Siphoviridae sp. ctB3v5 TaxID=2826186 RepID=A0A8S5M8Y7_9CAUD|nr:MAG TPA: hypothetical protein [Siphoviridae sp. ctB3v5]
MNSSPVITFGPYTKKSTKRSGYSRQKAMYLRRIGFTASIRSSDIPIFFFELDNASKS